MIDGDATYGITASIGASSSSPCVEESRMKKCSFNKVKFTEDEDKKLKFLVEQNGAKDWIHIASLMETRNPRQCRERWNNYINPSLRSDQYSPEEDALLEAKYAEYGPSWNKISKFFEKRSDNSLRNRWMMIARHRAKHMKVQISPPPSLPIEPLAFVMPVVKEFREVEKRPQENSFEVLSIPTFTIDGPMDDFWNDFTF